ncbi:MAG: VCBS repeat-containing protein [Planctomycetes bacterium]|nr:VCBS repeat-containing protein [Planctomycetota bacterium]
MNRTATSPPASIPLAGVLLLTLAAATATALETETNPVKPRVIPLDFAVGKEGKGSVVAADLDGDGRLDFVVTAPGNVGAYRHDGQRLWRAETDIRVSAGSSESAGLPGHDAPGVQIADVDGDGAAELLHLDQASTVHIRDARSGKEKKAVRVPAPEGAERWEHLAVANLRGRGDRDLVLQATNAKGYRMGRHVAACAIESLDGPPLWKTDRFGALAHGPLRLADLDGDGRDEVCGYTILGPGGQATAWRYPPIGPENAGGASFHIDSLFVADVRPDVPGLEVVLLEEGRNHVGLVSFERGIVWWTTHGRQEPQNAAVGEFDPSRAGLEVWCRSRYDTHQKPWVLDAHGNLIVQYELDRVAPPGWTEKGVEEIAAIHWTGAETQLAAAKERHESGDVCLFEPLTGKFVARFVEQADRLYVADVAGDWREEIIVASGKELHIYENPAKNPRPDQQRLWSQQHYRRSKMSWNYYSP